jgi:hypothetical protein
LKKGEPLHKLFIITPAGRKIQVGYLSPCRDGFVMGVSEIPEVETSHLTVLHKDGRLSSHITPQKGHLAERRYFLPVTVEKVAKRLQAIIENNLVFPLRQDQMSEEVMYITQRLAALYNSLLKALYSKETSRKEVRHIIDFKKGIERIPELLEVLQKEPELFFGLCKAEDLLSDASKIAGITKSKMLIINIENSLVGIKFGNLINYNPSIDRKEISGPLAEVYRGMGIQEYIQEIQDKKYLEKLFSEEK